MGKRSDPLLEVQIHLVIEVNRVGHQDKGVDGATVRGRLPEPTEVGTIVIVVEEYRLTVVAVLHDVKAQRKGPDPFFPC